MNDQRTSAIPQAGIHLAILVASAEHLIMKLGKIVYNQGWKEYFISIPGLEYFYPHATECIHHS